MVLERIDGSALLRDGSGDIVASARGGVTVESDGSGDVVIH
jgi:hypothetical protein